MVDISEFHFFRPKAPSIYYHSPVSHSCNLILVPSFTSIILAKKSTPTVGSDNCNKRRRSPLISFHSHTLRTISMFDSTKQRIQLFQFNLSNNKTKTINMYKQHESVSPSYYRTFSQRKWLTNLYFFFISLNTIQQERHT